MARVEQRKQLKALEASKVKDSDVMLKSVYKDDEEDEEWDSERFKKKMKQGDEARIKQ